MGRYENDAQHHLGRIKHAYEHAGFRGYSQAEYHWGELTALLRRASRSKNDKTAAIGIQEIIDSARTMMDEMQARQR